MNKRSIFKLLVEPATAVEKTLEALEREWVTRASISDRLVGCKLAETIMAKHCNPRFPRSTVDGYAVDYRDLVGASEDSPVQLRVKGVVRVYEYAEHPISKGEAVEVDTGSMLPPNANAVVPVEYTERVEGYVRIYRSVGFGENVAWPCSDVSKDEPIAVKGRPIDSRLIGVLASQGITSVKVHRPRICIFSTGEELVDPGAPLRDPLIYDSNRFMLKSLFSNFCSEILSTRLLGDDLGEITAAISDCEERGADIIVFTGGTSAGVEDYVYRAIRETGTLLVHGLKLKPGKPTAIGVTRKGALVLGLPGNPNSAYNVFVNIVVPLLSRKGVGLCRYGDESFELRSTVKGLLALPVKVVKGRISYNPAYLLKGNGRVFVFPISYESYMVTRLALSDAAVIVPEEKHEVIEKGSSVEVLVYNSHWDRYRISILGEQLPPSWILSSNGSGVKYLGYGSGFGAAGVETCTADIAVIGTWFQGLGSLEPGCAYLEEYAKRRLLVLEAKTARRREARRRAVYPAGFSIASYALRRLSGDPVYASSYLAAYNMLLKGIVDYAVVPADLIEGIDSSVRVVEEFKENYVIMYRSPMHEETVYSIIESFENSGVRAGGGSS